MPTDYWLVSKMADTDSSRPKTTTHEWMNEWKCKWVAVIKFRMDNRSGDSAGDTQDQDHKIAV